MILLLKKYRFELYSRLRDNFFLISISKCLKKKFEPFAPMFPPQKIELSLFLLTFSLSRTLTVILVSLVD